MNIQLIDTSIHFGFCLSLMYFSSHCTYSAARMPINFIPNILYDVSIFCQIYGHIHPCELYSFISVC